jgi:hypothetical protein
VVAGEVRPLVVEEAVEAAAVAGRSELQVVAVGQRRMRQVVAGVRAQAEALELA